MRNGWQAEIDGRDNQNLWIAVLYYGGSFCAELDGVWFTSKKECEEFIRTDVVGAQLIDDKKEEER